uniref:Uncharacterized protein n=1 Tax=Arundo donax TaxID=35708 RepID=A0A0A8Y7Q1_ARUDO
MYGAYLLVRTSSWLNRKIPGSSRRPPPLLGSRESAIIWLSLRIASIKGSDIFRLSCLFELKLTSVLGDISSAQSAYFLTRFN